MSAVAGALAVGDIEGATAAAYRRAAEELSTGAPIAVIVYRGLCAETAVWVGHGHPRVLEAVRIGDPYADAAWAALRPRERWQCADWVEENWNPIGERARGIFDAEAVAVWGRNWNTAEVDR